MRRAGTVNKERASQAALDRRLFFSSVASKKN
jgi:hypothetical protein